MGAASWLTTFPTVPPLEEAGAACGGSSGSQPVVGNIFWLWSPVAPSRWECAMPTEMLRNIQLKFKASVKKKAKPFFFLTLKLKTVQFSVVWRFG